MFSTQLLKISARVVGESGRLDVFNPLAPQIYHHLTLRTASGRRRERVRGEASYTYQLRAFVDSLRTGRAPITDGHDAIANMTVIDAIYRAEDLPLRGTPGGWSA